MRRAPSLRLGVCAVGALAVLGLAACGSGEHSSSTANSASASATATTSAATAPANVRTPSGHVFPGEGTQIPRRAHTDSAVSAGTRSPVIASRPTRTSAPATAPSVTAARAPGLGRYVGPPRNGANPCGYVAIGPGLEQASAFVVHGVSCDTARALASDKRHQPTGGHSYSALGFDCVSAASSATLRRFSCTAGAAAVSFVVS